MNIYIVELSNAVIANESEKLTLELASLNESFLRNSNSLDVYIYFQIKYRKNRWYTKPSFI